MTNSLASERIGNACKRVMAPFVCHGAVIRSIRVIRWDIFMTIKVINSTVILKILTSLTWRPMPVLC